MPLSEHEQRLLEQMERALYQEDPKFASTLRSGASGRAHRTRAILGIVAFLGGIALLLSGVATTWIWLGVLGFAVMLAGALLAYGALRPRAQPAAAGEGPREAPGPGPAPAAAKKPRSSTFMHRVEERWRRRRDSGDI
ncbi:MAG: DUF3040 domain-containing protein [Actinomycetota bacterium]|nr:MAG: DUF3040 domain-containing protein [Actinomycetota bacterium]